jgi:hypothetical protein
MKKLIFEYSVIALLFISCERDVNLEIPGGDPQPVVEGWIEPNSPPIIILTRSQPYFGTTNFSSLENLFIHDATVYVTSGTYSAQLVEICSNDIPDSLLPVVGQFLGIDSATLASINFCIYTSFDEDIYGETGMSYSLTISTNEGWSLSSITNIPQVVPLDSIWFREANGLDSLGYVWSRLTDPDTLGNCYRWSAMRKGEDNGFVAPMGSPFEDKFINGTSFDFGFNRGDADFSNVPEPEGERGYFKVGDTVIVKFSSMDYHHYLFWRTFETQVINNGNPFAAPAPVKSNIDGGLGIWGGYAPAYDTLVIE